MLVVLTLSIKDQKSFMDGVKENLQLRSEMGVYTNMGNVGFESMCNGKCADKSGLKNLSCKYIKEIDSLRFLFMLMIFIHHVDFSYGGGCVGTVAFFVISGFCMALGYGERLSNSSIDYKSYLKKRVVKLFPMHWLAFLLVWGISYHFRFHFGPKFLGTWFLNASLLQSWVPLREVYFSYNSPSWFISDILFLTILFPFIYRFLYGLTWKRRLLFLGVCLTGYCIVWFSLPHGLRHYWLYIFPCSRLLDYMLGILSAMAFLSIRQSNNEVFEKVQKPVILDVIIWLFAVGVVLQSMFIPSGYKLYAAIYWPCIIVLLVAVSLRSTVNYDSVASKVLNNKILLFLGKISFAFYLLHIPVMMAFNHLSRYSGPNSKSIEEGILEFVCTLLLSIFCNIFIETRLTSKLLKLSEKNK